jgi:peptide deformylase
MAVLPICRFPDDKVLRQKVKKVSRVNASIQRLIDDMIETMQSANGVGLAAPQVGVSLRVIVLQMPDEEPRVIINPEIIKRKGKQNVIEGCLSVLGYYGELKRSTEVTVKGMNRRGKNIKIRAVGLLAEALEHETNHLEGILYIDHIKNEGKLHTIQEDTTGGKEE